MDSAAAQRIARLALQDAATDTRILEIGAGTGALTQALLEGSNDVTALEIDPQLVAILANRPELRAANVLLADAMSYDFATFSKGRRWHATGNLPYNVATPLMLELIEMDGGPATITVMIQKDVADRLAAKPATPAYGSLSIAVQYEMNVERAFTLGPRVFYPPPKVDSSVVRLVRRAKPAVQPRDVTLFRKVVRAAFAYRRKTLANSLHLALGLERSVIADAIAHGDLPAEIRGEQLDIHAFARLADALAEK